LRKLIVCALMLVVPVAACAIYRPDRAIRVATGYVAHNLCSQTFVSGFDPQTTFSETIDREGIRSLRWLLRYQLDRAAHTVDTSTLGLFAGHAVFREGFGCVLIHGPQQPYLLRSDLEALRTPKTSPLLPEIAGPAVVEPSDAALKAALDQAFEEPARPPFHRTKAVVVVRDGRVMAERYAEGIGVNTPLLGFSMAKSVVNALIGIMTQQGLTSPSLPAPIVEWRAPTDPRREIEVGHLLRMTSGLALDETNSGLDPSSQMMFLTDDMAGFAVQAPSIAPPGTRWHYSSATTEILAKIIRDATGGPEQTLAFAWRELFNPLGMRDVTLEFDAAGTLQGLHAGERARLGALRLALSSTARSAENASCTRTGWTIRPQRRSIPIMARASGPIAANIEMPWAAFASAFPVMHSLHPAISASASRSSPHSIWWWFASATPPIPPAISEGLRGS
jgi:CubicO group peptidase (beta-lactamase class C family)